MDESFPNFEQVSVLPLLPEQLPQAWDAIRIAAACIIPEEDTKAMEQLYMDIKRNLMFCYFLTAECAEGRKVLGLMLLQPSNDRMTGEKVLHLFLLYAYARIKPEYYHQAFEILKRIAHSMGVKKITAVSAQQDIIELVEGLGGKKTAYLTLEV